MMEPEQSDKIMVEPKVSIAEASEMSLEEYITAAGIKAPPIIKKDRNNRKRNQNAESVASMDIDESMPDASSLQWRLKDPNRPVGMAPLIPAAARQKEYYRNHRYFGKPYADRDKPNGVNRNNQARFKKNGMRMNANCHAGLRNAAHPNGMCNAALVPFHHHNAIATLDQISENVVGLVAPLMANSSFENVFNKLLEKWEQKKIQSTPKYNMAVQKEMSQALGKSLTFTCSSGLTTPVVVTQDGEGVDDCEVKPVTTDVSMHQRFA